MNGGIPLIKDFREHLIPSTGKQELSRTRIWLCLDKFHADFSLIEVLSRLNFL